MSKTSPHRSGIRTLSVSLAHSLLLLACSLSLSRSPLQVVPAWRAAAHRYATARRLERRQVSRFGAAHLAAWRARAGLQRTWRANAVAAWRAKCRNLLERPFRAWFLWVDQRHRVKVPRNFLRELMFRGGKKLILF